MKNRQAYFRTEFESEANFEVTDIPLTVICGGIDHYYTPIKEKSHRYDYSLVYVTNGSLKFTVDGMPFTLNRGCFLLREPNLQTEFSSFEDYTSCYWVQFSGSDAKKLVENLKLKFLKVYDIGIHSDIKERFELLFKEFLINDDVFDTSVSCRLAELLTTMMRKANAQDKHSLNSIEYIRKHYNENIDVAYLASLESKSISHYRSIFKKEFGTTPYEYILSLRINTACFYLEKSNRSIDEIAQLIGYDDQFYFSRIFKKKMGLSPLKYRQGFQK